MTAPPNTGDPFLFVCARARQPQYAAALHALPYRVVFVDDVVQLLNHCIEGPPQAVLIDTVSSIRMGAVVVNALLELRTTWPILRCSIRPDGVVNALCATTDRHGTLTEALHGIAAGDPGWLPRWKRRHVRVGVLCRARVRVGAEDRWRLGNCVDLSCGGAFVVSYELYAAGDALEIELRDLLEQPTRLRAHVMRVRKWDDAPQLPGIGVAFDAATVPADLSRVVTTTLLAQAFAH